MTKSPNLALTSNHGRHRHTRPNFRLLQNDTALSSCPSTGAMTLAFAAFIMTMLIANNVKLLQSLINYGALSVSSAEDATVPVASFFFPSLSTHTVSSSAAASSSLFSNPSGIRVWGCQRNETPTIFVHLGKAGGGNTRARFAAGAQNYSRDKWFQPEKDEHYYPIPVEHSSGAGPHYRRGKFCTSIIHNYLVLKNPNYTAIDPTDPFFAPKLNDMRKTFEGSLPCNATTPLGLAVACPQPFGRACVGCELLSDHCDAVYMGHNLLGSELHWLPPRYLKKWWKSNWVHPSKITIDLSPAAHYGNSTLQGQIEQTWNRLGSTDNDAVWCTDGGVVYRGRPTRGQRLSQKPSFVNCARSVVAEADEQFVQFWPSSDYSPIYASMPLLRTTVVREPWPWMISKFHWHQLDGKGLKCDSHRGIWIPWVVKEYLLPFCGVDCENRWDLGVMTLEEMAIQAENNLKQSFAVVGLLTETDSFYDMVTARIAYLNMSMNTHVAGRSHKSGGVDKLETKRCKALFQNTEFQEDSKRQYPELKLIERVYQVAVEVNRFQQQELSQCQRRHD